MADATILDAQHSDDGGFFDRSVAVNDKIESPLRRLPLEPRQGTYTIILDPQWLVDRRDLKLELDPWVRSFIYPRRSGKLRGRVDLERDGRPGGESEEKLSESDIVDAHRFSEDFIHEWRTAYLKCRGL